LLNQEYQVRVGEKEDKRHKAGADEDHEKGEPHEQKSKGDYRHRW
jgi:hypothetical protein